MASVLAVDDSRARSASTDAGSVAPANIIWDVPLVDRLRSRAVGRPGGKLIETKAIKKGKDVGRGRKK